MPVRQDLYNARFEFGHESFDVIVQKFDYSWRLVTTGDSQSRQRHVVYPKRVERTALSVSLIFRNRDEYIAFGKFMRDCHLGLTNYNNPYDLFFISSKIKHANKWFDSESNVERYGIKYSVAIKSIPMNVAVDTVAPTMTLTMEIIRDMLEPELDEVVGIANAEEGSYELRNAAENLTVYSSDIAGATSLASADDKYR